METQAFDVEDFGSDLSDEELVAIVESGSEDSLPALKALMERDSPESMRMAEKVLKGPDYHRRMKMTAVHYLESAGGPEQASLMVHELESGGMNPTLQRSMVKAVGKIGGKESFRALEKIKEAPENLPFALSLLSYRHGLDNYFLEPGKARALELGTKLEEVRIVPISVRQKEALTRQFTPEKVESKVSLRPVAELVCQGNEFIVNAGPFFQQGGTLDQLWEHQAVPFLVLKKEECPELLAEKYFVLTHPSEGEEHLTVSLLDPSGRLCYAGRIDKAEEGLGFYVRAVADSLTAPGEFRGNILPDLTIQFEVAKSARTLAEGKPKVPPRAG